MKAEFLNYALAGYPLLWVESHEEARAIRTLATQLMNSKERYTVYTWDRADGIQLFKNDKGKISFSKVTPPAGSPPEIDYSDPLIMLGWMEKAPENTVMLMKDFHHYVDKDFSQQIASIITRKIRNLIPTFKSMGKVMAVLSPTVKIPLELEKEVTVVPFSLPTRDELKATLKSICDSGEVEYPKENELLLIDSALGMTEIEAENAFSVSIVETKGKLDPAIIQREKVAYIRKTGLLEVLETGLTMADIGGNERLVRTMGKWGKLYTEEARKFGAPAPKGCLLGGPPGTGKTLAGKVIASVLVRPLIKLDAGKLFGSYVGESEANVRRAFTLIEALAPCVVLIDELDKAFGNTEGHQTHETTDRVKGYILNWMQERKADVFIVGTANKVSHIDNALLRAGRMDAIFWVDFPGLKQREAILKIHLKKVGRDPDKGFDLEKLSTSSQGFTGAELEQWIKASLVEAFDQGKDLSTEVMLASKGLVTPVIRLMGNEIKEYRQWAQDHGAIQASESDDRVDTEQAVELGSRKISKGGKSE